MTPHWTSSWSSGMLLFMENDTNGQLREVLVQYRQIERQLEALNLQK